MSALTRFDPFEDSLAEFIKGWPRAARLWRDNEVDIKLDVSETDQEYRVRAEIPGVKKEDISVKIEGNTVTVSAEVKKEKEDKSERFLRQERFYGAMARSFNLASSVDDKAAQARYVDGVLEMRIPKKENAGARKLVIQ